MANTPKKPLPLTKIAAELRRIGRAEIVEVITKSGELLKMARDQSDHGEYLAFLKQEGWSYSTATRRINSYEFSLRHDLRKCQLSVSCLYWIVDQDRKGGDLRKEIVQGVLAESKESSRVDKERAIEQEIRVGGSSEGKGKSPQWRF